MSKALTITLIIVSITSSLSVAGQIGYVEDFALAKDRAEALKQLIPGTEDYYFYHCLHYQNSGQINAFNKTFKAWLGKHKGHRNSQMKMFENRRALLEYTTNPQGSLRHIQNRLNLLFNHQRQTTKSTTHLRTKLDEGLISRASLSK
ncbi:MAG: hypothetical protein GY794_21950, partial [bacterium]|nr:hypothetical protein [bacterium]